MKIKTIYAVLLVAALGAANGVFAQNRVDDSGKYATMERIVSKSNWLGADNPTGLIFNKINYSTADINYDYEKGALRNVNGAAKNHTMGVQSESYRNWGRLSFYGKIGFNYISGADRAWAGNVNMYDSPMNLGDSLPGNVRTEKYYLKAGVAYQIGRWVIGAMGEYENQSLSKRRDIRNKNEYMHLSIRPGVMYMSKPVNFGLNVVYERTTEDNSYKNFGTNENMATVYLFEGLWFYTTEQTDTNLDDIFYKGGKYGGSAQIEFNLSKSVKFFNQFSMDYSDMERFREGKGQKLGDSDILTYRYLGQFSVSGDNVDHVLRADATFGDLLKYNNIQELVTDPDTNQKKYEQYGRIQKFSQTQRRVDASYRLYVKRNEWNSSWVVGLDYNYFKNASDYRIIPILYKQDIHYSRFAASVTKNFLFNDRNWLDVTLKGGYAVGGGTQLDQIAPEGVMVENANYRADLLAQEYNFLTNDRALGEAGLRYTHSFPKKKMGLYVDLKGRCEWARSGMFKNTRRGGMTAAVGVNF